MRRIKSEVSKCALGATHPWSTGVYLPLWKTEIQEILGAFGVCISNLGVVQFLNYTPERSGAGLCPHARRNWAARTEAYHRGPLGIHIFNGVLFSTPARYPH